MWCFQHSKPFLNKKTELLVSLHLVSRADVTIDTDWVKCTRVYGPNSSSQNSSIPLRNLRKILFSLHFIFKTNKTNKIHCRILNKFDIIGFEQNTKLLLFYNNISCVKTIPFDMYMHLHYRILSQISQLMHKIIVYVLNS